MPASSALDPISEFDLEELAALAPQDLSAVAPGWEDAKRDLVADVTASGSPPWLRPVIAAAVVLLAAAIGFGALHSQRGPGVPAGPSSAHSGSTLAPEKVPVLRQIPKGKYLVQTSTVVEGDHKQTDTTWWAWDGRYASAGTEYPASQTEGMYPKTVPGDPSKFLAAWADDGNDQVPSSVSPQPEPPAAIPGLVSLALLEPLFSDPITSPEVRRVAVEAAKLQGCTVTEGEQLVVRCTDQGFAVSSKYTAVLTIDPESMDTRSILLTGTQNEDGKWVPMKISTTFQPLVLTDTKPKA